MLNSPVAAIDRLGFAASEIAELPKGQADWMGGSGLPIHSGGLAQLVPDELDSDRIELSVETQRSDPLMAQLVQALKSEAVSKNQENDFYIHSLETALAAHLIRHYSMPSSKIPEHEKGLSRRQLHQAIEYVQSHLDANLSLTAIAHELDLSPYYFCRLFKQSMGISPHRYLIQQRIERAKQLLARSSLPVTQVALECGFANPSHLAKHFRKQTGLSPIEFRQSR
jgi:AraC family transcriptional regulator